MLVPTSAWWWWSGTVRAERIAALDQTLDQMEKAEIEKDYSSALRASETALEIAERSGIAPPGGIDALRAKRDELARSDADIVLTSLSSTPPDQALRHALAIANRIETEPALSSMSTRVTRAIAEAATRWTDQALDRASEAIESGQQTEAMAHLERLAADLQRPPRAPMAAQFDRVRAAAIALIDRYGAQVEPFELVSGPLSDPEADYRADALPVLQEALKSRGYLIASSSSPLAELWPIAPFRLRCGIVEKTGVSYLQSPHRTSLIAVDLVLDREGEAVWRDYFEARTRVPLQGLSVMESSRMVLGSQPNSEIERRLYRDARTDLLAKLLVKLSSLPSP